MKNALMITAVVAGLAMFAGANTAEAGGCYRGGGWGGYGYRAPVYGYGTGYGSFRGYRSSGFRSYGYSPYRSYGNYGYNRGFRGNGVQVRIGW